jgi:hypothetical protein
VSAKVIQPDPLGEGDWWMLRQKTTSHFDFGRMGPFRQDKPNLWKLCLLGNIETTIHDKEPYPEIAFLASRNPVGVICAAARAMDFSKKLRKRPGAKKTVVFNMKWNQHMCVRARAPRPKIALPGHEEVLLLLEATTHV